MQANQFHYLLFVLLICVFHQQHATVQAINTCFGYSATDIFYVCGGHGFCQSSDSCYCTDSTSSSSLYSNGANTLNEQNSKFSSNNVFEVRQQNDGNLVLYQSGNPYWSSGTYQQGSGAYSLVLSGDGTLQLKGSGGGSVVKTFSGTCGGGTSPFTLVMQNDGNLVLYGAQKEVCWSSDSYRSGYSRTFIWDGDRCNQYLCYGSVGSSACSGHGSCVGRDTCSCSGGYSGSQCSTYYCNGVLSSQTGTVCSGHGTCTQPETCSCNGGYSGTYCNSYMCGGLTPSDPNVCNGFGTCASPDTCTNCQAGRYGSLCQYYDCGGIRFDQGNVCSSRGSCDSSNNCTCPEPYFGNNCESYTCNGVINNSSMVCSGHGTCSSPENCTCQEGYFGNDCEWFECSGVLKNETSVCSGFGNCTAFDTCQCDAQHTGTSCEINICNGVLSNNPSICSAHGQCNSFNNCTCDENYSGQNCEIYDCYGASKNSSTVCSGRGTCTAYNNCTCQAPFYGSDCGLYNCFGVEHLNSSTCSSHGSCDSPNNCTCQPGYYGKNCEMHNCYGTLFNSSTVCSTHGQCSSPNNCQCEAGYYGLDCSEHDCFGVNKNSSNVCFKHGTCLSPNNCSCQEGYFSFDCSNHECFGYLFNDTNVCSGHGACLIPSNCTCQAGYYGITCEMHNCYGTLFNSSTVCSTHGQCSSPNNCQCEAGYYGKECSEHDCFGIHKNSSNVCYNHGSCLRPNNCSCQEGYFGFDCSNHNCYGILFNDTNVCSGHGSCYVPENCTCKAGYYGITCEMHNCFDTLFNETSVCSGKGQCVTPNNCSCVQGFTDKDCSVNISPFQINITKYEEIVYLEFDSKNISVEINLIDEVLSQSPNISYSWTCVECDGQNVIYNVESNRLVINNTLTDVTQAGNYTFIANASIANIGPFESRKSNLVQFRLIVKYDLNQPTLGTFGLPSVLVSGTQDQTISTVINSITLNQTTVRYFLGCVTNCSTLVSYSWQVKAGIFSYKKSSSVVAKYENNNLLSFSPSVPIQASIPTDYLNETVIFTFTVINSKQQNISSSVQIQIISSASPPSRVTVNNLIDVVPTQGVSMNDKFTIKITEWVASTELLPLRYAVGYFDKSKSEPVRLSEYSLNTTISSYLPYIRSSNTKTRSILETTESIALVVFVKDALGNVETQTTGNVTVSPFNGTQEQYIEVVKSLSGESLLVASVDQTFSSTSASPSLISALISNVDIDPKNPSSSLSSLETLTSNNETLSPGAVSQVITKLDSFVSSLTDVYLSELALYGYVKSALSTSDVTKTVQIISNCFSTSYDSEKTKSTANNVTVLVYYGTIPAVVDSTSSQLPTTTYASSLINITVSSFNSPTPISNLQTVSDSNSNVAMNLTSIMSKYDAFSMTCGATMIVYSTNTNYDASVSNFTISSSVSDFKFMKKVDVLILENLDSPLILSFSASTIPSSVVSNSTITNSTYHCKYWDEKLKMWSSNGCKLYGVSSDSIKCACTHTTMFTTFLESKTTALTVQLKDQVSSLYYAQISFGIIYLVAASAILIGLIVLRKSQPVSSRLLTPYVGLIALIVECTLIYIVQRSVLVDQLNSANSQMWESGDTAANIIANIVMIVVNTLNLTAIFCYVMQVFRFQFMKLLYKKLSENRTQAQSTTVLKALKYATSQALFYSLIGIFAAVNVVYWIIWVALRRTNVLSSTEYTYVVSVSYTVCILAFGLIITAVAILDLILSSKKEVDNKKNRRKAVNFSQPASTFSLDNAENINEKRKINKNLLLQAFHWFTSMDGPLYFRMEMFIYIISFILLILNQVIGLSSLSYRFETLSMFKIALTFDSISFIFEVLYVISYILVFGGYALIVAIIYKVRQSKTRKEEKSKQDEEIMNQELYNTLESGEGYELFANFCEKEFSSENLFLFSDIKAHQDVANGQNLGGVLFFSEKIYSKYIKTGAEMEVNIPSKSRTAFIQLYEKCKKLETSNSATSFELLDSGSLSKSGIETNTVKDCFDLMIRQVVMNLGDTFSRFVFTPEYLNFKAVRDAQLQIIEKANVVYGI